MYTEGRNKHAARRGEEISLDEQREERVEGFFTAAIVKSAAWRIKEESAKQDEVEDK